jgi:nitrogen fixation NifU-like protein
MHSEALLDHFHRPRHAGQLDPPALVVDVENPACGDWLRLSALVEDGVVQRAAFQVRGCTASIACGSALAEWLHGRRVEELRAGGREAVRAAIAGAVGPLPPASRHAAELCADGVAALLGRLGGAA